MAIIVVADRERYWRDMAGGALERGGHRVIVLDEYAALHHLPEPPDMILLGFPIIRRAEEEIIRTASTIHPRATILVLSTFWLLPQSVERRLFRLGIADVVRRPSSEAALVKLVDDELAAREEAQATLSSYARFRLREVD